jgi:hypothetical protein
LVAGDDRDAVVDDVDIRFVGHGKAAKLQNESLEGKCTGLAAWLHAEGSAAKYRLSFEHVYYTMKSTGTRGR